MSVQKIVGSGHGCQDAPQLGAMQLTNGSVEDTPAQKVVDMKGVVYCKDNLKKFITQLHEKASMFTGWVSNLEPPTLAEPGPKAKKHLACQWEIPGWLRFVADAQPILDQLDQAFERLAECQHLLENVDGNIVDQQPLVQDCCCVVYGSGCWTRLRKPNLRQLRRPLTHCPDHFVSTIFDPRSVKILAKEHSYQLLAAELGKARQVNKRKRDEAKDGEEAAGGNNTNTTEPPEEPQPKLPKLPKAKAKGKAAAKNKGPKK